MRDCFCISSNGQPSSQSSPPFACCHVALICFETVFVKTDFVDLKLYCWQATFWVISLEAERGGILNERIKTAQAVPAERTVLDNAVCSVLKGLGDSTHPFPAFANPSLIIYGLSGFLPGRPFFDRQGPPCRAGLCLVISGGPPERRPGRERWQWCHGCTLYWG